MGTDLRRKYNGRHDCATGVYPILLGTAAAFLRYALRGRCERQVGSNIRQYYTHGFESLLIEKFVYIHAFNVRSTSNRLTRISIAAVTWLAHDRHQAYDDVTAAIGCA